ncbi:DUF4129 domain-containing protein, partial [archaeon]|nr:DUF4129 domain-containing protein [archaeon]
MQEPQGSNPMITASFNGSTYYDGSSNITTYTVLRGASIILDKNKEAVRNRIVNITGKLLDDEDKGITDCNISIYWQGEWLNNTPTNENGEFSYSYFIPANHFLGNVTVEAVFEKTENFVQSEAIVNYTVMARTNITISAKILRRGEFVDINGTLFDDMGNGVTGDVEIFWDNTFLGMAVSGDDGNFSFGYPVAYDNPLGPVRVDVVFNASGFYGESDKSVFYNIVSNTTIIIEQENVFRNTTMEIKGRIVDDQGAGIWNLTINITLEDNYNITKSNDSGFFSVTYYIPANHFLGNLTVNTSFKGSDFYLSSSISINYSVVSNTTITMFPKTVFKGSSAEITGSVVDDNGTNVKGLLNIYWDDEYKGNITSNDGFFTFQHNVSLNQSVGTVRVAVVFPETGFYLSSENTVNYTIIANTTLTFSITEPVRGESFAITGTMFENCSGQEGAPVPKHQISILLNDLLIGCIFTGINGSFMLTDTVPAVSSLGKGTVNVTFKGSLYLKPSNASANVTVKERIKITINAPSIVVENGEFECEIILSEKIFNLTISVELTPLCDEGQTQVDSMFYNILPENGLYCFNLTTDKDGKASFLVSAKFAGAMSINASFQGKEHFTGAASNKTVLILRKQAGEKPAWMYFLIIPIVCLPGVGYYVLRKRHLSKMRKIIVDARGELIAGSEYIRTILKLYKRLCDHLKKHGLIRKKFETFREFENAIKKTLPVDREHLNKFIAIIEEVRYSSHDIGSRHR